MLFDEFDQYSQDLLLSQYDIAEIIQHELTKGEVREDFLIHILQSRFEPSPTFYKGTISDGNHQAGQLDLMLCRPNCQIVRMGGQAILRPEDCLCLIEVKGNATGNDLRVFDERIQRIKAMEAESFPLCGIFCYKVELQEKTIMNRFGFDLNAETGVYYNDENEPREIAYPNIDFFVSLDERGHLFLRKNTDGRFIKLLDYPVLKAVYRVIGSLIKTAEPN
jgi:hypothetical protein